MTKPRSRLMGAKGSKQIQMQRLLNAIERVMKIMNHAELRPLVSEWNGSPNIHNNLAEFFEWQSRQLHALKAEARKP